MTEVTELKQTMAGIRTFLETKVDPLTQQVALLQEEQERVATEIKQAMEFQREMKLGQILAGTSNDRPRVTTGKYRGMDVFDLCVMSSVSRAFIDNPRNLNSEQVESFTAWHTSVTEHIRAMDSTTVGAGDELVQTMLMNELWADVNLLTTVASLFRMIVMPSNPFEIPLQLGDVNWYPGTSNVAGTSTNPATAKRTLTAFELVGVVPWALDLDEDAVIAMLPEVRALIVRNAAEVQDDICINADTTETNGINSDGATITAGDAGKAQWLIGFNGLRHIPLVDNTGQNVNLAGAPSDDMFNQSRVQLGKYGVRPSEVAHIIDLNTFIRSQAISTFRTLDKLGPNATLLTGQLGAVEGIPVVVSEFLRLADADGLVTDAGNVVDTGSLLTVNRTQWWKGMKRDVTIETERDIQKRQTVMVASMRLAFTGRLTPASDTSVGLIRNITGVT